MTGRSSRPSVWMRRAVSPCSATGAANPQHHISQLTRFSQYTKVRASQCASAVLSYNCRGIDGRTLAGWLAFTAARHALALRADEAGVFALGGAIAARLPVEAARRRLDAFAVLHDEAPVALVACTALRLNGIERTYDMSRRTERSSEGNLQHDSDDSSETTGERKNE